MQEPQTIIVDFESFYDTKTKYDLKHLPFPEYILDPRFKVFGLAANMATDMPSIWVPAKDVPDFLESVKDEIVVVHNAFYDAAVMAWHYKFRPRYILDTLQLANHVLGSAREAGGGGNGLAALASRLGLEPKGRIEYMDGVDEPDEAQLAALAAYARNDATLQRQVFDILRPQVGNAGFEFWLLDHTIRIYTEKTLHIDTEKLAKVRKMIEARRIEAIKLGGVEKAVLNSNPKFAAELKLRLKRAKMKVPMKKPLKPRKDGIDSIPALSKGDAAFQKLGESSVKEVADLVNARIIERSAVTVAARLATMQKYADMGIGIPVHLVYYGAHTGRFAGGGGFNFQNLTSPTRGATAFDREVARLVREVITAGPGNVFVPTDAAQIEARVLAWLAGEQGILDAYASGADLYSDFISEVLKKDVHKPTEADKKDPAHYVWLGIMRQIGKESILGLGYSMGDAKFYANVKNGGSVKSKDLIKFVEEGGFGAEIVKPGGQKTTQMAMDIVEFYRDKYENIPALWNALNKAFERAVQGATVTVNGKVTFSKVGDKAVAVTLPSGRKLYYRNLRPVWETGAFGKKRKVWMHGNMQRVYGGLLTENIVQAISRDILAESIYAAESAGFPVVLHIHDEVVPRVPKEKGKEALDFLIKSLSTAPEWGQGMVLSAEGHVAETLAK